MIASVATAIPRQPAAPVVLVMQLSDSIPVEVEAQTLAAGLWKIYIVSTIIGSLGMQVAKWGNSLAVRLPTAIVEALGLREGDDIEFHVADPHSMGIARKTRRAEMLERLRAYRGRLPDDFKFDRDEANAR